MTQHTCVTYYAITHMYANSVLYYKIKLTYYNARIHAYVVTWQPVASSKSCSVMHLYHNIQLTYYSTYAHKL